MTILIQFFFIGLCSMDLIASDQPSVGRPMGRGYHAMAYDTRIQRLLFFGGQTGDFFAQPERFLSTDVWAYDPVGKTWRVLKPAKQAAEQPPALTAHAMAYDAKTGKIVVYGGVVMTGDKEARLSRQTWTFDSRSTVWTRVSDGPPERYGHRMIGVPGTDRIVLFGGACVDAAAKNDAKKLDETWIYDIEADRWTNMNPSRAPSPRHYSGMAYDERARRILVWGGAKPEAADSSSVWAYDPAANAWTERKPVSGPKLDGYAVMAYDAAADKTVLYGGNSKGSDETWVYDYGANTWTRRFPKSNPGLLSRMPLVYVPEIRRTFLFGGQLGGRQFVYSDETWLYDAAADEWTNVTVRSGEYLGQRIPGTAPEAFAPALMSSPDFYPHGTIAFSADGNEAYWGVATKTNPRRFTLFWSRRENGMWTPPREAPFLGQFWGLAPYFSPDGRRLYFQSNRPQPGVKITDVGTAIWYVDRTADGWSEPKFHPINTGYELSLTQTRAGAIYMASYRDSLKGMSDFDLYRAAPRAEGWGPAERIGPAVNTGKEEYFPFIAADESFLIFESDRKSETGESRLYLSFRNPDGSWGEAIDLSEALHASGGDRFPSISPDGKYLFFCSTRGGSAGDIYWVDARIIDGLRPKPAPAAATAEANPNPAIAFKVDRLSPRVAVLTYEPAQRNTTIVLISRKGVVVVDTNLSKSYGQKIRETIVREFARGDIRYVINTHEDWDHTGGNQAFADAAIIGHINTYKSLKADQLNPQKRIASDLTECRELVTTYETRLKSLDPLAAEAVRLKNAILRFRGYLFDLQSGQLFVPPNVAFDDHVFLDLGDITLRLIYFGKAHRTGDILVYCPEEKLLMTGDLIFDMNLVAMPEIGGGYESPLDVPRWLEALHEVLDGGNEISYVVEGHDSGGLRDRVWLAKRRDYLKLVWDSVVEAKARKASLEETIRLLSADRRIAYDTTWESVGGRLSIEELNKRHRRLIQLFWEQSRPAVADAILARRST